eukprot:TRINITY_DN11295_c0_g2_i3.p1 TRINITY_DN11295_c0_g2~~TRINITY_DN11295_c0_g2_i3.p1  ORF type:complete len:636 (-),score=164.47 TRINITY_DN11295_c0_g2_i3:542-2308(-)
MAAVEEQMGQSLAKNAKQEIQNLVSLKEHDKMNSTWMAWMGLLNQTERISEVHSNFARAARDGITSTLQVAIDMSTERYNQIMEQEHRIEELMKMVRVNLEKSRTKAKKALNEVGDFDSIIEELTERAKKGERKTGGVFGMAKNRDKAVAKASEVAEGYLSQVDAANEFLHTYATREIPSILMDLQTLEQMRMTNIKFQFHQYIGLFENMAHGILELTSQMKQLADSIDHKEDIANFVKRCAMSKKDTNALVNSLRRFEYDLDVPLAKIRHAVDLTGKKRRILFQTTIPEIMDEQKREDPSLPVPKIFIILMRAIELVDDGYLSEGIFRISPNHKEVQEMIECLEGDLVDFSRLTPYLATGILKKWLRDLKEPVIPYHMYNTCVALGVQRTSDPEQYDYIVSQLPPPNRIILRSLIALARKIESSKQVTKMNFNNLAIVLGPSVLRTSDPDPALIFQNGQFECCFMEKILRLLNVEDSKLPEIPLVKEYEAKMISHIKKGTGSRRAKPSQGRTTRSSSRVSVGQVFDSSNSLLDDGPSQDFKADFEMYAPVPHPWIQCFDDDGYIYYYNTETDVSQWEYPTTETENPS